MHEFLERNGYRLELLEADTPDAITTVMERLASDEPFEREFVGWVHRRIRRPTADEVAALEAEESGEKSVDLRAP